MKDLLSRIHFNPALPQQNREAGVDPPLRYLVNTHWPFDHTSGNENVVRAGAALIAHEGVRRLLSEDQVMAALPGRVVSGAPEAARPTLTFNDRMNLDLNGKVLHLVQMPLAHTDGGIILHFPGGDVVQMGDLFFNGMYPFIDPDHGGNIVGMVRAVEEVLEHTGESTLFIPGPWPTRTIRNGTPICFARSGTGCRHSSTVEPPERRSSQPNPRLIWIRSKPVEAGSSNPTLGSGSCTKE